MAHKNKKQIAFYATEELVEDLESMSKQLGISRQKLMYQLIENGMKQLLKKGIAIR